MSVEHLDDLRATTRHARERYQLYEAKAYGPRPTSPAHLRELQRCYEQADARLRAAEAEAQRTGAAGDASVSGSLRGRSLRTSLNTDAHQRRYFCIASCKRACAASASARPDLVRSGHVALNRRGTCFQWNGTLWATWSGRSGRHPRPARRGVARRRARALGLETLPALGVPDSFDQLLRWLQGGR